MRPRATIFRADKHQTVTPDRRSVWKGINPFCSIPFAQRRGWSGGVFLIHVESQGKSKARRQTSPSSLRRPTPGRLGMPLHGTRLCASIPVFSDRLQGARRQNQHCSTPIRLEGPRKPCSQGDQTMKSTPSTATDGVSRPRRAVDLCTPKYIVRYCLLITINADNSCKTPHQCQSKCVKNDPDNVCADTFSEYFLPTGRGTGTQCVNCSIVSI